MYIRTYVRTHTYIHYHTLPYITITYHTITITIPYHYHTIPVQYSTVYCITLHCMTLHDIEWHDMSWHYLNTSKHNVNDIWLMGYPNTWQFQFIKNDQPSGRGPYEGSQKCGFLPGRNCWCCPWKFVKLRNQDGQICDDYFYEGLTGTAFTTRNPWRLENQGRRIWVFNGCVPLDKNI